jgi:hypothetical protein
MGAIGALGDDALQAHLLHRLVEGVALGLHRLDAAHAAAVCGQPAEKLPATRERQPAQVTPLGREEVEGPVGGRVRAGRRSGPLGALLEEAEGRTSLGVLHHHLAVEDEVVGRQ